MTPAQLHPEALIERERCGELDSADAVALAAHRRDCVACAAEARLVDGFARQLAPDDTDRARAAALVEALLAGGAPAHSLPPDAAPPEAPPQASTLAATGAEEAAQVSPRARPGVALLVSLAVHVAAAALVIAHVDTPPRPVRAIETPIEIALVTNAVSEPTPWDEPAVSHAPAPPPSAAAPRPRTPRGGAQAREAGAAPGAAAQSSALPSVQASVQPSMQASGLEPPGSSEEPPPGLTAEQLGILLAPSSVARAGWTVEGAPSSVGPPAGLGDRRPGPSEAELEARLSAGLRAQAMARDYLARAEPTLRRRADGAQVYEGHRFEAVIHPDGRVEFDDRPNLQTNGFSASGSFDLTEAFMSAAGQDPHFAERQWFMRHTRALREQLEDAHRATQLGHAYRRLPRRLERVWSTTARSRQARRARLFEIWDEMDEGDDGRRGRRRVIRFIRERLPAGSEHAYSDAEVERLNARRQSAEVFAPY